MENQLYELAYHIEPEVEAAQVPAIKEEIEKLITNEGGVVAYSKEPEHIRLSYPIKHDRMSYFGYVQFTVADRENAIAHIDEQLRLNNHIMRHLIVKLEERRKTPGRAPAGQPERRVRKEVKKDSKEIEKQLEDVISGL